MSQVNARAKNNYNIQLDGSQLANWTTEARFLISNSELGLNLQILTNGSNSSFIDQKK